MNKKATLKLRRAFISKHEYAPKKTKLKSDGSFTPSEWRQVKKHYNLTHEIL